MMRRLLIAVIGPAACTLSEAAAPELVGRILVEGDATVVCGGLSGSAAGWTSSTIIHIGDPVEAARRALALARGA